MTNLIHQKQKSLSNSKTGEKSLLSYYSFTKAEQKKYPTITRILKQLTPERIKREIKTIQKVKIPPELQKWVKEYEKIGERNEFIWKWIYKGDKTIIKFFIVPPKYHRSVIETVFLFHMFTNLIDDISEKSKGNNLLDELLKIPFRRSYIRLNRLNKKEKGYLRFTIKVWDNIKENIRKYPYYKKIKDLFEYDIHQSLTTTRYSFLLYNNPYLINKTEYWMYLPQNMQFTIFFNIYLMCCKFSFKDIKKFREAILYTQRMLRIGNDIGTWEREMENNDFANGICVYSISLGVITIDELKKENKLKIINKIKNSKIEKELLREWEGNFQKIKEISKGNKLTNIKNLLSIVEKITFYHLLSRGYI